MRDEEKQEDRRNAVHDNIYNVIATHVEAAEVVVQPEAQSCQRPVQMSVPVKCFLQLRP